MSRPSARQVPDWTRGRIGGGTANSASLPSSCATLTDVRWSTPRLGRMWKCACFLRTIPPASGVRRSWSRSTYRPRWMHPFSHRTTFLPGIRSRPSCRNVERSYADCDGCRYRRPRTALAMLFPRNRREGRSSTPSMVPRTSTSKVAIFLAAAGCLRSKSVSPLSAQTGGWTPSVSRRSSARSAPPPRLNEPHCFTPRQSGFPSSALAPMSSGPDPNPPRPEAASVDSSIPPVQPEALEGTARGGWWR